MGLTLATIAVALTAYIVNRLNPSLVYSKIGYLILYYYIISLAGTALMKNAIIRKDNFVLYYLALTVARLILSILIAFVFMLLDKPELMEIGFNFIILHFIFLGLDLFFIIAWAKKIPGTNRES